MAQPLKTEEQNHEFVEILKKVALFSGIATNNLALIKLAELMTVEHHPVNHTLIKESETGDKFFVLLKGQVSIHKNTPDGDSYKVVILKSENHPALGEGGIVEAEPRSATVVCDVPCEFLVLSREQFNKFTEANPEWSIPVMKSIFKTLMGRVRKLNNDLMLLHNALTNEIRGH